MLIKVVYILVKGTITTTGAGAGANVAAGLPGAKSNQVSFKNWAKFINWISKINNKK